MAMSRVGQPYVVCGTETWRGLSKELPQCSSMSGLNKHDQLTVFAECEEEQQ